MATVTCLEETTFAVLGKDSYQKLLARFQEKHLADMVEFLRFIPYFKHWPKTNLVKFSYFLMKRTMRRTLFVFKEGEPADSIFIIQSGEFEVR